MILPVKNRSLNFSKHAVLAVLACALLVPAATSAQESAVKKLDETSISEPPASSDQPARIPADKTHYADPERDILPDVIEESELYSEPWSQKVRELERQIFKLEKTDVDADVLFVELGKDLRERLKWLGKAISDSSSVRDPITVPDTLRGRVHTLEDLMEDVEQVYGARLSLLELTSDELREEVNGTKLFGAQEIRTELRYVLERVRYQVFAPGEALRVSSLRTERSPVRLIGNLIAFTLLIVVFNWWRSWFPETLASLRQSLQSARPRTALTVRRMKIIWYLEQVRSPLEWLIFLNLLFAQITLEPLFFTLTVTGIVVSWLLVARATVLLLNAIASRGDIGLAGEEAALRLKSLRLVSAWLLILGIGLSLADYLTGEAALYAGVWRVFQIFLIPVLLILLIWWRPRIFQRLELEPEKPPRLEESLKHQHGLRGYAGAASGLGMLVANNLRRSLMRRIVSSDISSELSQSAGDDNGDENEGESQATAALRDSFMHAEQHFTKYARNERREILARINSGKSNSIVLSGVRGIGTTRFLESLAERMDGTMLVLGCETGLAADFLKNFQALLGMNCDEAFSAELISEELKRREIKAIAIDDAHRLIKPGVGIAQELDAVFGSLRSVLFDGTWLLSIDRYAWRYLQASRPSRTYADTIVELPGWTEEQFSELTTLRCEELGIDPDFSDASVPRQYLEGGYTSASERNRNGIIRALTEFADGNIAVLLRLWTDCLVVTEAGHVEGTLPALESTEELDNLAVGGLLLLRTIAQFERITPEDIQRGLRLNGQEVETASRFGLLRGWIEETPGGLTISWHWFPVISRILARQNLLAR